jgi:hypothetical protein
MHQIGVYSGNSAQNRCQIKIISINKIINIVDNYYKYLWAQALISIAFTAFIASNSLQFSPHGTALAVPLMPQAQGVPITM